MNLSCSGYHSNTRHQLCMYVWMHIKQQHQKKTRFLVLKMVTPCRHKHAGLPFTPTFHKVSISKRQDKTELKPTKTHFDRLKHFGLLLRRLTFLFARVSFGLVTKNTRCLGQSFLFDLHEKKKNIKGKRAWLLFICFKLFWPVIAGGETSWRRTQNA